MSSRSVAAKLVELRRVAPTSLVPRRFKADHHAKDAHHHPRPTQDEWGQPIEYDEHGEKITRAPVWFMEDRLAPGETRQWESWEYIMLFGLVLILAIWMYDYNYGYSTDLGEWAREEIAERRRLRDQPK
jgi:hypothetical protein